MSWASSVAIATVEPAMANVPRIPQIDSLIFYTLVFKFWLRAALIVELRDLLAAQGISKDSKLIDSPIQVSQ